MYIPGSILFGYVEKGNVYLFNNPNFANPDNEHFHVVVNCDPQNQELVVLVNATSKVEKQEKWIQNRRLPKATLVQTNPTECSFLSKPTAFNCNNAFVFSKDDMSNFTDEAKLTYIDKVPKEITDKICAGLKASPVIEQYIKDLL